ncbi:MAG: hypothetical protein AAF639_16795, partial [Chloroflexota bacterium]
QQEMRESQQEMRESQQEMRESQQEMRESQQEMRESQQEMRESQQEMRESMQKMQESIVLLNKNQEEMRESQQEMRESMQKMQESIVLLNKNQEVLFESQQEMRQEMQKDIGTLKKNVENVNKNVFGLGESLGYSLENEAYRLLPAYLEREHNIKLNNPMLRSYVEGQEVNILGTGTKDDKPIVLVGEAKTRLATGHFEQLWRHILLVKKAQEKGEIAAGEIVPIFVTHMARQQAERKAKRDGVMIVHSFQW